MKTKLHFVVLAAVLCCGTTSYGKSNNSKSNSYEPLAIVADSTIVVKGNLVTIPNGDTTPSNLDNTIFHSAQVAGETQSISYLLMNGGSTSFTVSNIFISGVAAADFSITTMPVSTVVAGDQTFFVVTFNPSAVGMRNATIEIDFSAPTSFTYTFAVQGKGLNFTPCSFKTVDEIIAKQNFESYSSSPIWGYSVTSGSGSVTSGSAYGESGSPAVLVDTFIDDTSFQVSNSTCVLTFNSINTMDLKDISFSANLGSFSTNTSNGSDTSDYVSVAVSTNGGLTWSNEIVVKGSSQAKWSFDSGVGIASSSYSSINSSVSFSPSNTDYVTTDGYGTITLSGLPNATDLRIRVTLSNDDAEEIWAIDEVTLKAKREVTDIWNGSSWSLGTPDNTMRIVFNGDYDTSIYGDLTGNNYIINSDKLIQVTDNHILSSESDILNSGNLTVESGGAIYQIDDFATNSGNVTVNRDTTPIRRFDYTYWCSPVGNQTLYNLSPNTLSDKYYSFDPVAGNWALHLNGVDTMASGVGYIVRAPQTFDITTPSVYSASFNGPVNNGVITTAVNIQSGQTSGWNLIGNPYPSALKIDDFLSLPENEALIGGTIYLWTHNSALVASSPGLYTYTSDDYATYNFTGSISADPESTGTESGGSGPSGIIASGQSFFVKGLASGSVIFNNSMRMTYSNDEFYKLSAVSTVSNLQKNRIWLDMKNNQGAYKETLVGYIQTATNGMDSKFDGITLNGNSYLNFYSINNLDKLAIQGRALPFDSSDQVDLGYYTSIAGTFTINIKQFDGLFSTQNIYLKDKLLNVVYDLKSGPYSFTTAAGTFDTRFTLLYSNSNLTTSSFSQNENTLAIVTQESKIILKSSGENIESIILNDILGKTLFSQNYIDASGFEISTINPSNQILLVTVITTDGKKSVHKVLF